MKPIQAALTFDFLEAVMDNPKSGPLEWVDITSKFLDTTSELNCGELLHEKFFNLFEGMSAIEVMDPKMDIGMLSGKAIEENKYLSQLLDEKLQANSFSDAEVLAIMDHCFATFVSWIEGNSLIQTIFANALLHDTYLPQIRNSTLQTFCMGIRVIVDLVKSVVNIAGVGEEEDLQPLTFELKCNPVSDVNGVLSKCKEVCSKVQNGNSDPLKPALLARIKMLRALLLIIADIEKGKISKDELEKLLSQLRDSLKVMEATINLGSEGVIGFSPLLNFRYLPPAFPKFIEIVSEHQMLKYFKGFSDFLQEVAAQTHSSNLLSVIRFFKGCSHKQLCILSRSLLQLYVLPKPCDKLFGEYPLASAVRECIKTFVSSPCLVLQQMNAHCPDSTWKTIETFFHRASCVVVNLLRCTCFNLARQREKFALLLQDINILQNEADHVDNLVNELFGSLFSKPLVSFGTWVLYLSISTMIEYVQLGLTLQLYAVHEYHYIFWYLNECLYSWLINTINRADAIFNEQEAVLDKQQQGKGRANFRKNRKKSKKTRPLQYDMQALKLHQVLTGAYFRASMGLLMTGLTRFPSYELDNEEIRYNHRFSALRNVATPPLVSYGQFRDTTDMRDQGLSGVDFFRMSVKHFEDSLQLLQLPSLAKVESAQEIQRLVGLTKRNLIVMKLLTGGGALNAKRTPVFSLEAGTYFPLLSLT